MLPEEFEAILRNKEFGRSIQGYNPKQVDRYLKKMAVYYGDLYNKHKELLEKTARYEQEERFLRQALVRAEETAEEIREKARAEAGGILRQAQREAEHIRQEAAAAAEGIRKHTKEREEAFMKQLQQNRQLYEAESREWIGDLYYAIRSKMTGLQAELLEQAEQFTRMVGQIVSCTDPQHPVLPSLHADRPVPLEAADMWRRKEEELLVGYELKEDIIDGEGNVVCPRSSVVTPDMIRTLVDKELYGELLMAIGDEAHGRR